MPADVVAPIKSQAPSRGKPNLIRTLAIAALVISLVSVASLAPFPELGKFGVILAANPRFDDGAFSLAPQPRPTRHNGRGQPSSKRPRRRRHARTPVRAIARPALELRDNDTRYRELLDSLDDMIIRRDASGNLTFVNRTFCRMTGLDVRDCLGKPWTAPVATGGEDGASLLMSPRRRCERLSLANGDRWIEWEEHSVPVPGSGGSELQSVGRDITERLRYETQLCQARDAAGQRTAPNRAFWPT